MARLLKKKDNVHFVKPAHITTDPTDLKPLLHSTAWHILQCIADSDKYPSQIAAELNMHEQKVYYHMRQLERAGIITVRRKEEYKGALTKYYMLNHYAFALELPYGEEKALNRPISEIDPNVSAFLFPHIAHGELNTTIVVGSPDPHGPYQVRGRDGHCAIDVAAFLGQHGTHPGTFMTKLDVAVKAQQKMEGNYVLVGGPLTNLMTGNVNNALPITFETEHFPFNRLFSEQTGTVYDDPAVGVIEKIPNPFSPDHSILVLAGNRYQGTLAATLALTTHLETILEQYQREDRWGCVVQGKDLDGDGTVDAIDIIE